ncbi:hypothetical protein CPB84DRAFT_385739 [Gymnopilus junonius]|uniref:Uncharacterized protein n=1 Tax=Gymnopilus junonius TaxID=109634 RepID=A0A9P5NBR2_GYMJU|nr:hypothetical protein CPB84DRAFT_385739 [Gymnopilus junonius]
MAIHVPQKIFHHPSCTNKFPGQLRTSFYKNTYSLCSFVLSCASPRISATANKHTFWRDPCSPWRHRIFEMTSNTLFITSINGDRTFIDRTYRSSGDFQKRRKAAKGRERALKQHEKNLEKCVKPPQAPYLSAMDSALFQPIAYHLCRPGNNFNRYLIILPISDFFFR